MQRIKFSRSQTSKRPGEAKQKTLQTSKKWLAAVFLASQTRLERATPGLGGSCSIQLSYWDIYQKYSIFLRPRTRTNCRLGGSCSIQLSYWDIYQKYSIFLRPRTRTNCRLGGACYIHLTTETGKTVTFNIISIFFEKARVDSSFAAALAYSGGFCYNQKRILT